MSDVFKCYFLLDGYAQPIRVFADSADYEGDICILHGVEVIIGDDVDELEAFVIKKSDIIGSGLYGAPVVLKRRS